MITQRQDLAKVKRWIIKIGSSLLTANGRGLDHERIAAWSQQIAQLRASGYKVVLVSSGAVAEGLVRLGWNKRPTALNKLQAAASVGQTGLVEVYSKCFQQHGQRTAQVLLTHADVENRRRYLNARNTLLTLLGLDIIPIVNENDAIATDEIRIGDNDTMAALAANLIDAYGMIILTDQQGVFDSDPRKSASAQLISESSVDNPQLIASAGESGGSLGQGGMRTKILAAQQAARGGTATLIANGLEENILKRLIEGEMLGTLLTPDQPRREARKNWLAGQRRTRGAVIVDAGAAEVLKEKGRSLLPIGIVGVGGQFRRGDLVACKTEQGVEIARGLANYSSAEAQKLIRQPSENIEKVLGYAHEEEFIHRDNLVLK